MSGARDVFFGFSSFHLSVSVDVPMARLLVFFGLSVSCSGVVLFVSVVGFSLCFIWLVVGFSVVFLFCFEYLIDNDHGESAIIMICRRAYHYSCLGRVFDRQ